VKRSGEILGSYVRLLRLSAQKDSRGTLFPYEFSELPFMPQRAFVTRVTAAGVRRGGHAHKLCRQILVCLYGKLDVEVSRSGENALLRLDAPDQALLIEPGVWSRQIFVDADAQLLAFMSEPYDPDDYLEAEEAAPAVP